MHTYSSNMMMMSVNLGLFAAFIMLSALVILLMWGGWRIVNWVWIRPRKIEKCLRGQGLNGNSYRLLFGDSKDMGRMNKEAKSKPISLSDHILPRVLPLHHHIITKYGKRSFIWIGPVARILIMEPQLIKQILNDNHVFKKPTPNPLAQFLVSGLSSYEDHKWAKHRKIINPAFYLEKLKEMVPAMHTCCSEMVNKWENELGGKRSVEIDVQPYFEDLTSEIISLTAFGSSSREGIRTILELQREQAELTRQVLQSLYIPGWRWWHVPTKRNRRLKEINNHICSLLMGIIKKRELGSDNTQDDDLLGILLKSSNDKEIEENGGGMSMDEVIEECKTFYFSGQESTSNLLSWTMLMLSIHQSWQKRARDELFQVFGQDTTPPHFDGLNHLKIVSMILNEVLRLYPPATIFNRIVYKETKVGEMSVPGGVHLLMPVILMHYDEELWGEDVKEFKPERFSQGVAKATNNHLCFFPFSWGPRMCIGNNFALIEVKMALAMILRRFSFELSPSYTHAPSYVLTLQPQHGIQLIFTKLLT